MEDISKRVKVRESSVKFPPKDLIYTRPANDLLKFIQLYLSRTKDETLKIFIKCKIKVDNQKNKIIKQLRTNRGGEYEFNYFKEFCK
jgi:hypothetical protein